MSDTAPLVVEASEVASVQGGTVEVQDTAPLVVQDTAPLVVEASEVTPVQGGTVEVTAPADLQEGYVLSVNVGGNVRSVMVPEGGVKEGQIFQAGPTDANGSAHFIPTGNWRDGLCDCCKFGCCHAMFCMGWFCEPILAAQIMTRMSRSWIGGPGARPSVSSTCTIVTAIFVVVSLTQTILQMFLDYGHCPGGTVRYDIGTNEEFIVCPDDTREPMSTQDTKLNVAIGMVAFVFGLYLFIAVCRTRAAMRAKYNIATGGCGGCEDCCCTAFCSCLTIQQMARHTHDYSTHEVTCCGNGCCNKRGQPEYIPEIEV